MSTTAKLVRHGVYQYVRLPKELQFKGDAVRVSKVKKGLLLQQVVSDVKAANNRPVHLP